MKSGPPDELTRLRDLAESQLRHATAADGGFPEGDPHRLRHELEVHRIELNLQLDELRRAQAEIEAGLARYTDLFDSAPVSYFNLTNDGTIRLVNLAGAQLLGADRSRLIGRRLGLFVAGSDREAFADFLTRAFATATRQTCELSLVAAEGAAKVVRLEAILAGDG